MATRAAKTTAKKTATPAKKTTAARAPRTRKTAAKKTTPARLSLVKPTPTSTDLPTRPRDFITNAQIYATHAAKGAGIPVHRIRDWRDHRNQTATRPLADGSLLHYDHNTRTLTWQAICPMGATHTYVLTTRSVAAAARVHADRCNTPHADLTTIPALTPDELEALGLLQTPTWARKDVIGEAPTKSIPAPLGPKDRALIERTQPLSLDEIAAGVAARTAAADTETPKEHPQP
jgi:hypothetical protein